AERLIDTGVQRLLLVPGSTPQDVARHLRAVAGMADAQTQAMKSVVVAQLGNGVAKSVVPTVTTAFLAANHAGGQVELVMGDQDLLGGDAIEAGQRGNRLTAAEILVAHDELDLP